MIKFIEVHKWFKDLHVLNGINFHVKQGEVVVVCGPSGSGKSTLIRCINSLEPIQKGQLIVDGMDLSDKKTNITKLRAEIGFVFQQFNLYPHLTTLKNITLAPIKVRGMNKKEAEDLAMSLLERVGLTEKRDSYPAQLSGGQQQRVAIARALAMKPKVMLFDEPTSALDPQSSQRIEQTFVELKKDYTIVIVTHILRQARRMADYVVFLYLGELIEYGPAWDFFNHPKQPMTREYIKGLIS